MFVEELDEVPDGAPVVFSAHGVPKSVPAEAQDRGLDYLDATCPLVSKVHRQAERLVEAGRHIVFIGHAGHPEVIGTFGQVPEGAMTLIETVADAETFAPADPANLAFLTQTTLSVDDTAEIVATLQPPLSRDPGTARRGHLLRDVEPASRGQGDRRAMRRDARHRRAQFVQLAAPCRSRASGAARRARLIQRASEIDFDWLGDARTLGITAGASAPELLVREVVATLAERYTITEREDETTRETVAFKLPRGLDAAA